MALSLQCAFPDRELCLRGAMMPKLPAQRRSPVVAVVIDDSGACVEEVVRAAKEAARQRLPLELLHRAPLTPMTRLQHALHLQRMDTAVVTAREAVPGLEVRLAEERILLGEAPQAIEHAQP